ncbi:MAG: lipase family protein, partial [Pseudomonadota bacterium]
KVAITAAALLASTSAMAQWQGTWDTSYGKIKLKQDQAFVYGDYGTWGTIEGVTSNDGRLLRAVWKRKDDGRTGYLEWRIPQRAKFEGRWRMKDAGFASWNSAGTAWDGTRTSTARPALTVYRGNANIGAFIGREGNTFGRWIGQMGSNPTYKALPDRLQWSQSITPWKVSTAFEMQRHVRAVSSDASGGRSGEYRAAQAYQAMGWQLLGRGIVTENNTKAALLRAAVAKKGNAIVVAFRGTGGDRFWETGITGVLVDGNITPAIPTFIPRNKRNGALVHSGFLGSYMALRGRIMSALDGQQNTHLFITGHSLGGALAALLAYDIGTNQPGKFISITSITSGAPRVGNSAFVSGFQKAVPDSLRVVVNGDPVPSIPYVRGLYRHAGRLLSIDQNTGAPVSHQSIDTRFNLSQRKKHANTVYFDSVNKLKGQAARNRALNPNGDSWAAAAARSEVQLASQTRVDDAVDAARNGIQNGVNRVREGAGNLRDKIKERREQRRRNR